MGDGGPWGYIQVVAAAAAARGGRPAGPSVASTQSGPSCCDGPRDGAPYIPSCSYIHIRGCLRIVSYGPPVSIYIYTHTHTYICISASQLLSAHTGRLELIRAQPTIFGSHVRHTLERYAI